MRLKRILRDELVEIILLGFFSIVILYLHYSHGGFNLILFHDSPYPLDSFPLIRQYSTVWRDIANFGYFDPTGIPLAFFYLLVSVVQFLTMGNIIASQFIILLALIYLSLLTVYCLLRNLELEKRFSLFGALLYTANPYSLFYVWRILNMNIFLYAAAPLIFLGIMKTMKSNRKFYGLLLLIGTFIAIPSFTNPGWFLSLIIISFLFSLFCAFLRLNKLGLKTVILKSIKILVILILPFLGYIIPLAIFTYSYTSDPLSIDAADKIFEFETQHITPFSIFSLSNFAPIYGYVNWYTFEGMYSEDLLIVLVAIVVSLLIVAQLLSDGNRNSKSVIPFVALLVTLGLFILPETGAVLIKNIPMLFIPLRRIVHKIGWGISLCLAVIISSGLRSLLNVRQVKTHKSLVLATLLSILFLTAYWAGPFLLGHSFPNCVERENDVLSAFVDLRRYSPLISYLKQDADITSNSKRVLVYPFVNSLWCEDGFWGKDPLQLSGISTISSFNPSNSKNISKFLRTLSDISTIKDPNYTDFISRLGIKYILLRKLPCERYLQEKAQTIESVLNNLTSTSFKRVMDTDHYALYKIEKTSTLFSVVHNPAQCSSYRVNFTKDAHVSTPIIKNWTLEIKNNQSILLNPLPNASNSTFIKISGLCLKGKLHYGFIKIKVISGSKIETIWLSLITKNGWQSGPLFPYGIIASEGPALTYIFQVNKLEGVRPSEIDRIYINFLGIENSSSTILIDTLEFFNDGISPKDFLVSDYVPHKRINSCLWKAEINATQPFLLIFAESYDSGWVCYVNGQKIHSIPLYGVINGFYINQTGHLEITIEYEPQRWFNLGCIISLTTLLACLTTLTITHIKQKQYQKE